MLSEATFEVANIAEDFLKNFPKIDRTDRRNVITSARSDPNNKEAAFRLFAMTEFFFELFPYAELGDDDDKMTRLRKLLWH